MRVSGHDDVDDDGLLTGPDGTWLDETAAQATADLRSGASRAHSVLRQRPGHYYWQAYVTGAGAQSADELIGPVQELTVTLPAADKGRGTLVPALRQEGRTRASTCPQSFPASVTGKRFQTVDQDRGVTLGPEGPALDERQGGGPGRLQRRRLLHDVESGVLGVQTDFIKHGKVIESDLALRAGENWDAGPDYPALDQVDLESVVLHELGHMAGNKKHTLALRELADGRGAGRRRVVARVARQVVRRLHERRAGVVAAPRASRRRAPLTGRAAGPAASCRRAGVLTTASWSTA